MGGPDKPSLGRSLIDEEISDRPAPGVAVALDDADPFFTFPSPAFFLLVLPSHKFGPDIEFFADGPVISNVTRTALRAIVSVGG